MERRPGTSNSQSGEAYCSIPTELFPVDLDHRRGLVQVTRRPLAGVLQSLGSSVTAGGGLTAQSSRNIPAIIPRRRRASGLRVHELSVPPLGATPAKLDERLLDDRRLASRSTTTTPRRRRPGKNFSRQRHELRGSRRLQGAAPAPRAWDAARACSAGQPRAAVSRPVEVREAEMRAAASAEPANGHRASLLSSCSSIIGSMRRLLASKRSPDAVTPTTPAGVERADQAPFEQPGAEYRLRVCIACENANSRGGRLGRGVQSLVDIGAPARSLPWTSCENPKRTKVESAKPEEPPSPVISA